MAMDLDERSEEYAKTATPFAWQHTTIAAMFREVYSLAIADAAAVARESKRDSHSATARNMLSDDIAAAIEALVKPAIAPPP